MFEIVEYSIKKKQELRYASEQAKQEGDISLALLLTTRTKPTHAKITVKQCSLKIQSERHRRHLLPDERQRVLPQIDSRYHGMKKCNGTNSESKLFSNFIIGPDTQASLRDSLKILPTYKHYEWPD